MNVNGKQRFQDVTPAADDQPAAGDATALLREIRDLLLENSVELLDREAAARYCGVSTSTWDRAHSKGDVPTPVYICGCPRWSRSVLLTWVKKNCATK